MVKSSFLAGSMTLVLGACAQSAPPAARPTAEAPTAPSPPPEPEVTAAPKPEANPLLAAWAGPHGGVPPFAKVRVPDFKPALLAAMDDQRRSMAAIADQKDAP